MAASATAVYNPFCGAGLSPGEALPDGLVDEPFLVSQVKPAGTPE